MRAITNPLAQPQPGAGEAIAGYRRGAAQARSGVEQNYQMELSPNRQVFVSQFDAAGRTRNAGLEAAKLRQAAAVVSAVEAGYLTQTEFAGHLRDAS